MNKALTSALFCYLFFSFLCIHSVANPGSLVSPDADFRALPTSNFPWSSDGGFAEIEAVFASVSDDFIIRRKVDFNRHTDGYYTDGQFRSDWGYSSVRLNINRIQTVDGKKALANFYRKGTWGNNGGLNQWGSFEDSSGDLTEIYWTYRIKYQSDFDWAVGNKLPGVS